MAGNLPVLIARLQAAISGETLEDAQVAVLWVLLDTLHAMPDTESDQAYRSIAKAFGSLVKEKRFAKDPRSRSQSH